MTTEKDILTTGDVAKICSVAMRTVCIWIDSAQLAGYRIPGSKVRRVHRHHLIEFMRNHGMPLNGLMPRRIRVLLVDGDRDVAEVIGKVLGEELKYEVQVAQTAFAAGMAAGKFRPHVVLLNGHIADFDSREVAKQIRSNPDLKMTKIISTGQEGMDLSASGFDGFLRKPFKLRQVIQAVEDATAAIY